MLLFDDDIYKVKYWNRINSSIYQNMFCTVMFIVSWYQILEVVSLRVPPSEFIIERHPVKSDNLTNTLW